MLECNRQGLQEGEIEAINLLDSKTRPFLLNSRDNAVNKLVLTVGLLNYLTYAVVVRRHFSSATTPGAVRYGIIASCVGLAAFIYLMLRNEYTIAALVAALAIFAACLALFLWTAKTTRSKRLRQAFDPGSPGPVVQTGPYRYLRHPFYASYILFWLACIVATSHPLMVIFLAAFGALYLTAAYREERAFETSPFAEEYKNYRKSTGPFWPKLGATETQP
jgi:protein-S-isoprenylcysteine O-methyltransferase Ste14